MFGFKDRDKDANKKSSDESTQILVAPGTEITFKADLIDKYKQDHQHIISIFNNVLTAVQQEDSIAMLDRLRNLQIALRKHLLDEELNLYIYLRHCYKDDRPKQDIINKFKRRSKKVGVETFGFIGKLSEEGYSIKYDETFFNELLEIGNALEDLLETEEKHLYTIYRKPFITA